MLNQIEADLSVPAEGGVGWKTVVAKPIQMLMKRRQAEGNEQRLLSAGVLACALQPRQVEARYLDTSSALVPESPLQGYSLLDYLFCSPCRQPRSSSASLHVRLPAPFQQPTPPPSTPPVPPTTSLQSSFAPPSPPVLKDLSYHHT